MPAGAVWPSSSPFRGRGAPGREARCLQRPLLPLSRSQGTP